MQTSSLFKPYPFEEWFASSYTQPVSTINESDDEISTDEPTELDIDEDDNSCTCTKITYEPIIYPL